MIRPTAPDEKRISQTIQILDRLSRRLLIARQPDGRTLGPAANRAAGV
jgi:hypothetical protein